LILLLLYVFSRTNPSYLADDCQLVADPRVRQLRSADTRTLVVSRTRSSFGDRTFQFSQHRPKKIQDNLQDILKEKTGHFTGLWKPISVHLLGTTKIQETTGFTGPVGALTFAP